MSHRAVGPEELTQMIRVCGMTYGEIGEAVGLTESGVQQAAERYGLTRKRRLSHKRWLPWRVTAEHATGQVPMYLRILSTLAQGGQVPHAKAATALRWARSTVAARLDIDYDRELPPERSIGIYGGWYTKPADPRSWHLRELLTEVERDR